MTDFILRPPEEKDIEALARLTFYMWNEFYDFVPAAYAKEHYTWEQCLQYKRDLLKDISSVNKALALVAVDRETGNLAGLCYINQNDQTEGNDLYVPGFELELQHLYLWPQYRDHHLAGKLCKAILNWAREHGYRSVYWWVLDQNPFSHIHKKRGRVVKQMPRDYTGTILDLTAYGLTL